MQHRVLLIVFLVVGAITQCPQLCEYCSGSQCQSCFANFLSSTTPSSLSIGQTCGCPDGFYLNIDNNMCYFCPMRCVTCSNEQTCLSCMEAYILVDGQCVLPAELHQTGMMEFSSQLDNAGMENLDSYGFYLKYALSTQQQNYFRNCSGMPSQPFYGVGIFDWDSLISKVFYGIPSHKYVHIKFHYMIQDQWLGEGFVVQIENGRNPNPDPEAFTTAFTSKTNSYDSSVRTRDICGFTYYYDNLGIYKTNLPHSDSILKLRIRTTIYNQDPSSLDAHKDNMYFGIRDMVVTFGDCAKHCTFCNSINVCGACQSPYKVQSLKCVCDTSIAVITDQGNCIKCSDGEIVKDNRCIACEIISPGCDSCAADGSCIQCTNNYYLLDGKCEAQCPMSYYESVDTKTCEECSQGCVECSEVYFDGASSPSQMSCHSCSDEYIWHMGQCVQQCPAGFYSNFDKTKCIQCMEGCVSCVNGHQCQQCASSAQPEGIAYKLGDDGTCKLICQSSEDTAEQVELIPYSGCPEQICSPTANCDKCFGPADANCYSCTPPYLLQAYSCVNQCSDGYYKWFAKCQKCPQQCATCEGSEGLCTKCNQGYWLFEGFCIIQCPTGYYHSSLPLQTFECLPCQINNCNSCIQAPLHADPTANGFSTSVQSAPYCQQCSNGFYLQNKIFQGPKILISQCIEEMPPCSTSQYFNDLLNRCINCPANCEQCQKGQLCLKCSDGYFLESGKCVNDCPYNKYKKLDEQGVPFCEWKNPLCETYSYDAVNQESTCIECAYLDPSLILHQGQCIFSCPPGYGRSSLIMQTCDITCPSDCEQCNSDGQCVLCNDPYVIDNDVCVLACPPYHVSDGDQCTPCAENCVRCQLDGRCVECDTGLQLSEQGHCHDPECPLSQKPDSSSPCAVCNSPCQTCTDNPNQCTSCIDGDYYLDPQASRCYLEQCFDGMYEDPQTYLCKLCPPSCTSCSSSQVCEKCIQGFSMFSLFAQGSLQATLAQCMSECPVGYFIDPKDSNRCNKCTQPCKSCYGPLASQCLDCQVGYNLMHTTCVKVCPDYKFIDSAGFCTYCDNSCKTCYGPASFQCLTCKDDDYLLDGACYEQQCPLGAFASSETQCAKCNEAIVNCGGCTASESASGIAQVECTSCLNNYILYDNKCLANCPSQTYYDSDSNTCIQCSTQYGASCSQCGSSVCTQCQQPKILKKTVNGDGSITTTCVAEQDCSVQSGYYILGTSCMECSKNCNKCESYSTCLQCDDNYNLNEFDGSVFCQQQQCEDGFYYNSSVTIGSPCQHACTISHCASCDYFIHPDTSANTEQCLQCKEGYILKREGGVGIQCVDDNNEDWEDIQCGTGFYLQTNSGSQYTCEPCHLACASCIDTPLNCVHCSSGFTMKNGLCIKYQTDPEEPYPDCSDTEPNYCSLCADQDHCLSCSLPTFLNVLTYQCDFECPPSYFKHVPTRTCKNCAVGCQTCQDEPTQCQTCFDGFFMLYQSDDSGICAKTCPPGFYGKKSEDGSVEDQCVPCEAGCSVCQDSEQCLKCQGEYALLEADGNCYPIDQCPLKTFYDPSINECLQCSKGCAICNSKNICEQCSSTKSLNGNTCVTICPQGTYKSSQISEITQQIVNQCVKCSAPCRTCSNANTCIQCIDGYSLSANTKCVLECPTGYYKKQYVQLTAVSSLKLSRCEVCSSSCQTCSESSTTCTKCKDGKYLYHNQCVMECPAGMFQSPTGVCQICGSFCLYCQQSQQCTVCMEGFYLLDGECHQKCPSGYTGAILQSQTMTFNNILQTCIPCISPCLTCSQALDGQAYQCKSCIEGFYLFGEKCLQKCPSGHFEDVQSLTCKQCPNKCPNCVNLDVCVECLYGNTTNAGGQTLSTCKQSCEDTNTCEQCDILTCETCDRSISITAEGTTTGTCLQCLSGLFLHEGRCVTQCPNSYYANKAKQICEGCDETCTSCNEEGCVVCDNGYYLYAGKCYSDNCPTNPQLQAIPQLDQSGNQIGMECQIVPCLSSITQNSGEQVCMTCISPFILVEGDCEDPDYTCPSSTYKSQLTGSCVRCPSSCDQCTSPTTCTICADGYNYIPALKKCVENCPFGQYADSQSHTCVSCQQQIPACLQCSSSSQCQLCEKGQYLLQEEQCVSVCPNGYFPTMLNENGQCIKCATNCNQCTSSTKCNICSLPYYLLGEQCVSQCSDGYYGKSTAISQECLRCSSSIPYCTTCSSPQVCTQCQPGFYMYHHEVDGIQHSSCLLVCPSGTYPNQKHRECKSCSSPLCVDCIYNFNTGTDLCLRCDIGYYLSPTDGKCYEEECPPGEYLPSSDSSNPSQQYNVCAQCDPSCLTCTQNPLECTSCRPGEILSAQNTCIAHPGCIEYPNTYYSSETMMCQPCSSQCATCYGPQFNQCKSCKYPLLLSIVSKVCVQQCLTGEYQLGGVCLKCTDPTCKTCQANEDGDAVCKTCHNGLILLQQLGSCVVECPKGWYEQPTTQSCIECSDVLSDCLSCSYSIEAEGAVCNKCKQGYLEVESPSTNEITCVDETLCVSSQGLYINSEEQTCQKCPSQCATCSQSSATSSGVQCLTCNDGRLLYEMNCMYNCPAGTTKIGLECIDCMDVFPNCQSCASDVLYTAIQKCEQCYSPYFVFHTTGACVLQCPPALIEVFNDQTLTRQCITQTQYLDHCQDLGLVAKYNEQTLQWSCVLDCGNDYFADPNTLKCTPCSYQCDGCQFNPSTNQQECIKCQQNFYTTPSGECVTECSTGQVGVVVSSAHTCIPCLSPCTQCAGSASQCVACQSSYYLFNGQCKLSCPPGFFGRDGLCQPCLPECKQCTDQLGCSLCLNELLSSPGCDNTEHCLTGYLQALTPSVSCPPCDSSCSDCTGPLPSNCLACSDASLYLFNGRCVSECGYGFYENPDQQACSPCSQISGCQDCAYDPIDEISVCQQCQQPLKLSPDGQSCVTACSSLNDGSTIYSISSTDSGACVECADGCSMCQNSVCYECEEGKYLYDDGVIQECYTDLQCESMEGFYASQNHQTCIPCNGGGVCLKCLNSPSQCQKCMQGMYLLAETGECVYGTTCPDGTYGTESAQNGLMCESCESWDKDCGQCSYDAVNGSPTCQECVAPRSLKVGNDGISRCEECEDGWYLDVNLDICRQCSPTCETCSGPTSQQCITCPHSIVFNYDTNQCLAQCPFSKYPSDGFCLNCLDSDCDSCSLDGSTCQICDTLYLDDGDCVPECPTTTYAGLNSNLAQQCLECDAANCDVCVSTNPSQCLTCTMGFYKTVSNKCMAVCPSGTAQNSMINVDGDTILTCQKCKDGCKQCTITGPSNVCDVCQTGLTAQPDGSCIYDEINNPMNQNCDTGKFSIVYANGTQICVPCSSYCKQCFGSGPSQCLSCDTPQYQYIKGYCVPVCDAHYYYEAGTGCVECASECAECSGPTSSDCVSCPGTAILNSIDSTCFAGPCPPSTFFSNLQCEQCPTGCLECQSSSFCTLCEGSITIMYDNQCLNSCPFRTYWVADTPYNTCEICSSQCTYCHTSSSNCSACADGYYLVGNTCVDTCTQPRTYPDHVSRTCEPCADPSCQTCIAANQCLMCNPSTVLFEQACEVSCGPGTYEKVIRSAGINYRYCIDCPQECNQCTGPSNCLNCQSGLHLLQYRSSATCVDDCPNGFDLLNVVSGSGECINHNCQNCASCEANSRCVDCQPSYYLISGSCHDECYGAYFQNQDTWECEPCMQHCQICSSAQICEQCEQGYNTSELYDNSCVDQAYLQFGGWSNMSGWTSNITQITSLVYLSTSVGPAVFGEMTTTYFNIELCQFMFFHEGLTQDNEQVSNFVESLSFMSMSSVDDEEAIDENSTQVQGASRRRALQGLDTKTFLQINIPIFGFIGATLLTYVVVFLIHRNIDSLCITCPRVQFYVKQICQFMFKRFKWIYFDFVAWISYLPFLYFSLLQVKKFSFSTPLNAFSCIFSVVVLLTYPLYPIMIAYQIKKNYKEVCMENNSMTEMALSPWLYKVKRPETVPQQGTFVYCSKDNWRLIYYPLKYFRKFSYIVVLAICPYPITALIILIGINIVFIVYMAILRPRSMPYLVFDFIIQGVLLLFEVFILVYIAINPTKISVMSIVAHTGGFVMANISLIIAIVLNLIAYYKIFMCLKQLYAHLKEKAEEKDKSKERAKYGLDDELFSENFNEKNLEFERGQGYDPEITNNHLLLEKESQVDGGRMKKRVNHDDLTEGDDDKRTEQLGDDERQLTNLMGDKDLVINGIQPRYDDNIRISDGGNMNGLFDDKELFGGDNKGKKGEYQVKDEDDDELPVMKMQERRKKREQRKKKNGKQSEDDTEIINLQTKERDRKQSIGNNSSDFLSIDSRDALFKEGDSPNRSNDNKSGQFGQAKFKNRNSFMGELHDDVSEEEIGNVDFKNRHRKNGEFTGVSVNMYENNSKRRNMDDLKDKDDDDVPDGIVIIQTGNQKNNRNGQNQDLQQIDTYQVQRNPKQNQKRFDIEKYEEQMRMKERIANQNRKNNKISNEYDDFDGDDIQDISFGTPIKNNKKDAIFFGDNDGMQNGQFKERNNTKRNSNGNQLDNANFYERDRNRRNNGKEDGLDEASFVNRGKIGNKKEGFDGHEIEQGNFKNRNKKNVYQQENNVDPLEMESALLVSRKPMKKNVNQQGNSKLDEGKFKDRQGRKKGKNLEQINEENHPNQGQFKDHKGRKMGKNVQQDDQEIQQVQFTSREKKNKKNGRNDYAEDVEEYQASKKNNQEGFFNKKTYGNQDNEDIEDYQFANKNKKKYNDEFEEANYGNRGKDGKEQRDRRDGPLKYGEEDRFEEDEYTRIKKNNQKDIYKPKRNSQAVKFDDQSSIDEDGIPKRPRKKKGQARNNDDGLNIDYRSDISDSEDFGINSRKMRSQNRQKQRKKGNLNLNEDSGFMEEPDVVKKEKQKEEERKRIANARLDILRKTVMGEDDDLDTMQL